MTNTGDILQDFNNQTAPGRISRRLLFFTHFIALLCLGFMGKQLNTLAFLPFFDPDSKNGIIHMRGAASDALHAKLKLWKLLDSFAGFALLLIGWIFSFIICKKHDIKPIVSISILLYSFIALFILTRENIYIYAAFLHPGAWFGLWLKGYWIQIINIAFFTLTAIFLLFSKKAKGWWLND